MALGRAETGSTCVTGAVVPPPGHGHWAKGGSGCPKRLVRGRGDRPSPPQAGGCLSPFRPDLGGLSPLPPANRRAGSPQAPPPSPHAPALNGAPQPTGHQQVPKAGMTPPKSGGGGCATRHHPQGAPVPLRPHAPAHGPLARMVPEKRRRRNAPAAALGLRPVVSVPGLAPPAAPPRRRDARPVGVRASPPARPRRAPGGQRTPRSCLRSGSARDESPQFTSPVFSSVSWKRRRAETLGLRLIFFSLLWFFFFCFSPTTCPAREAISNPDTHARGRSLPRHPLPR